MFVSAALDVFMAEEFVFCKEVVSVERLVIEGSCDKLLRGIFIGVMYLQYN